MSPDATDPANVPQTKTVALHSHDCGSGDTLLLLLHGLFGSAENWLPIARQVADSYRVIVPDLRGHGSSPHAEDYTLAAFSGDLELLLGGVEYQQLIVLGHSFGARVAMALANKMHERVSGIVLVDMGSPAISPAAHAFLHESTTAMQGVPLERISSRPDADRFLSKGIDDARIRGFLLKNLRHDGTGWYWRNDLDHAPGMLEELNQPTVIAPPLNVPALAIRGANSAYLPDPAVAHLRQSFPRLRLVTLSNAGHWVHADVPQAFLLTLRQFAASLA